MALSHRRRFESVNYWPGFVDALSTMLLVIIFLLSVFMLAQFFLSREVTGKDTALAKLNQQIEELTSLLARGEGDVVALAERCQKAQPGERLRWMENWVTERIRKGLTAPAADHTPGSPGLPAALRRRHIQGLYGILDETRAARAALQGPASVAMLFERLFVKLARELEMLRTARGRG